MASISAGDLTTLRNKAAGYHFTRRLYLFNDDSQIVMWTGTISDASPTRGQQIYTVSGSYETGFVQADIFKHCYVTIGSSAKADDVSRRVCLNASGTFNGTSLTLDYADDYQASNGDNVTIWNFYPIWPKLAYADYTDTSNIVFYQDGPDSGNGGAGIAYAESHQLRPHCRLNMGAFVYRGAIPAASFTTFTADTEIVNPDASTVSYTVTCSPSSLATIVTPVPGSMRVTPQQAGRGYLHVKITDNASSGGHAADGVTEIHRPLFFEDTSAVDVHIKEFDWKRPALQRNNDAPRSTVTITAPDDSFSGASNAIDWTSVKNESLIIITQEDFFGGTSDNISVKTEADTNVIYFGFVTGSRERHLSGQDGAPSVELSLDPVPPRFTFAQSITGKTSPSNWLEARPAVMTASGGIYLSVDGHSTLFQVMDINLPWGDLQKRVANELFSRGNILQGIKAFANSRLYEASFRPSNRLNITRNINIEQSATRAIPATTMIITTGDVSGTRTLNKIERKGRVRTLLSGIVSDGDVNSADRADAFFLASQNVPSADASPTEVDFQRVVLASETEGQEFATRLNAIANQPYQSIELTFDNRYHHVFWHDDDQWSDLGDLVLATDAGNIRAIETLRNTNVIPQRITYNDDQGTMTVLFIPEAPDGLAGVSLPQPAVPDSTDSSTFTDLYTEITNPTEPSTGVTGDLLTIDTVSGPYSSADSGETFTAKTTGLAETDGNYIIVDPFASATWYACGNGWVEKSTDSGATWTDITSNIDTLPDGGYGDSPAPTAAAVNWYKCEANQFTANEIHFYGDWLASGFVYRTFLVKTTDGGTTWTKRIF